MVMSFKERFFQHGPTATNHDLVKALAITLMTIDHIGLYFFNSNDWTRAIGRPGSPLFFFLTGYALYLRQLPTVALWGILLTALSLLAFGFAAPNVLVAFVLYDFLFRVWKPEESKTSTLAIVMLVLIPFFPLGNALIEYGQNGFFWAIAGRLVRTNNRNRTWWLLASTGLYIVWSAYYFDLTSNWKLMTIVIVGNSLLPLLLRFRKGDLNLPKVLEYPIMFLSRFTLEIYVYHLLFCYLFAIAFIDYSTSYLPSPWKPFGFFL